MKTWADRKPTALITYDRWSPEHPVAINPDAAQVPVYVTLEAAVMRCEGAFAPGLPSAEWVKGWLSTGNALAGMRLIRK